MLLKGLLMSLLLSFSMPLATKSGEVLENGSYETTYSISAENSIATNMIKKYFDSKALIEVNDNAYYLSITQLNSNLKNLTLNINDNSTGYFVRHEEGEQKTYTFTLSKENLLKELNFSVYVQKMGKTNNFSLLLDKTSFNKVNSTIEDFGERPGEFVPSLTVNGANTYNHSLNEPFNLPSASSSFNNKNVPIITKVLFNDEELTNEIVNNTFTPKKEGLYKIIYHSSIDEYKTSLGNNSYNEFIISLNVSKDINKLVIPSIIPDGASLQVGFIENGTIHQDIYNLMLKESINYKIYNIEFIKDGKSIKPETSILYNIVLEDSLKNKKVNLYHYDNGELRKLDANSNGEILSFETNNTGVFVVMEPGLPFSMPIWGYILITFGILVLIITIIVIVIVKKKHK